ncbi:MAG TPA: hypothetical protein VNJ07_03965 [Chitinophagales bacterium]|nr:hypothetical protein [Chitinophagales bacterium]
MKAILCSVFPLLLFATAFARTPSGQELLFLKNHISAGFEIPFLLTQHGEHRGVGHLRLRPLPGLALKAEYTYNFSRHFGITSGAKIGLCTFGFVVTAGADDFDIPADLNRKYFRMLPFLNIPLALNFRLLISDNNILHADAGASALFYAPDNSLTTLTYRDGAVSRQIFEMNAHYAAPPQLIFHAVLSYGRVLKSQNILKAGVVCNFGKKNIMRGDYTFHRDDVVVGSGRVLTSFSHLAIEVCYIFTRASALGVANPGL